MSTRDSPGGKGGQCVRLTAYHPCSAERQEIRGLNLPGPPWAISTACCRRDLYLYLYLCELVYLEAECFSGNKGVAEGGVKTRYVLRSCHFGRDRTVHVGTICVWYGVARRFVRLGALNYYYITVP